MRTNTLCLKWLVAVSALSAMFSSAARADTIVYAETSAQQFGTVDLNTGTFNYIGDNFNPANPDLSGPLGFGVANGNLYTVHWGSGSTQALYEIDPATGTETYVADTGSNEIQGIGSTANGLYAVTGLLGGPFILNSLNPLTGTLTPIGATGFTNTSVGLDVSAVSDTGALFATSGTDLYSIDTSTGTATLIGSLGSTFASSLDTPDDSMLSLLYENGVLYGSYESSLFAPHPAYTIYTINTTTGLATALSTGTEGPSYFSSPYPVPLAYFAPDPIPSAAIPEPSSPALIVLMAVPFILAFAVRRRSLTV